MNPHLQRALILIDQSRHELAEAELKQVLVHEPNNAQAHSLLAICLAERGQYDAALSQAQGAIHLAPENAFAFYAHALVLRRCNRFREAQAAIEQAIGINPYHPGYFGQLAQIEFEQRRWKEALAAAEQGLALDPEDVACTNLRAMALVKLGRKMEAEHALGTALRRAPEDASSHANMGWSLLEGGQHQQAMEHFREALRLEPSMEWARLGIVEAMKSKYFIYRLMLNWFLWMMKLGGRARWTVILGAYIGYRVLRSVAAANPVLAPWIMPLLVAYVAFVIMTWVASPLFNLTLRLNRFGRLALSDEEIRTSNWVGLCVVGALGFVAAYFATQNQSFLGCAVGCAFLIPSLANIYNCSPGWPRTAIVLLTSTLAGLLLIYVTTTIADYFVQGAPRDILALVGGLAFLACILGAIASQLVVNALVTVRPQHGRGRAVPGLAET